MGRTSIFKQQWSYYLAFWVGQSVCLSPAAVYHSGLLLFNPEEMSKLKREEEMNSSSTFSLRKLPAINLLEWAAATNGSAFLNSLAVPTVHTAAVEAIFLSRYWFPMELSFEMMDLQLGWDLEEAWLCLCSRHEFCLALSSTQRAKGKERNH